MDEGAWWAAVHGVAESRARLSDFTFIFHFHALEKEMATHSSVLAWRIPGMGEPGGLPSMGLHNPWVRKVPWRKKWQPTAVFLPGEFHALRSLVGYSPRVSKNQTRLTHAHKCPHAKGASGHSHAYRQDAR